LTAKAKGVEKLNSQDVVRAVMGFEKKEEKGKGTETAAPHEVSQEQEWKEKLYGILTQKLVPAAFERLVQRLLRESGFTHVEITGRSGDGGIRWTRHRSHARALEFSCTLSMQAL
jgi:restriction system protein